MIIKRRLQVLFLLIPYGILAFASGQEPADQVAVWHRFELQLESQKSYDNPLYEVREFSALLTAPSGKKMRINGFWDQAMDLPGSHQIAYLGAFMRDNFRKHVSVLKSQDSKCILV